MPLFAIDKKEVANDVKIGYNANKKHREGIWKKIISQGVYLYG